MCCECCSVTQRKVWVFGLGVLFAALGTTLLIIWPDMAEKLMLNSLVLKDGTEGYSNWVEPPIPIYMEFHMFNWTNPEEIRNPNVKPNFVEMGPYVFLEKRLKQNITFYPNETVSYFQKRTWHFDADRSNGTLDDMLTAAHVITATVADQMRNKYGIIKKVVNFMLNREGGHLFVTKRVGEWIFDGYQDDLIDFLRLFNTSKIQMPYKKFGWMVDRNGSAEYDGLFTVHTGVGDIEDLAQLTHWNGKNQTGFYPSPCGTVNGTTGDVFPPHMDPRQEISIYTTDACRYLNLAPQGKMERYGVEGLQFVGTIETLDSGENCPNHQCFCNSKEEECPKTGVFSLKKCRYNAPVYASFPHFSLADKSYVDAVSGMNPDPEKHRFTLAVEPYTGVPLQIRGRLQINLMLQPDKDYDIYRGVPKVMMPMFWLEQKAELDEKLADKAKLAINLSGYGKAMGITFVCLGGLLILIGIILTFTKRWKHTPSEDEDMLIQD